MNTEQTPLFLHHYPTSPFAEKVRLMLGHKGLAWRSVFIPNVNPKPDLVALTGGYRKTPVLQMGADVFCDTALIADVLEHLAPTPTLYPEHAKGVARILAQWADSSLFWAAMAYNLSPKGAAEAFAGATPEQMKAFGDDRKAMSVGMTRLRPADATAAYKSYLRRLSHQLADQAFLLGAAPCLADFSAYHPLWFTRRWVPSLAGILDATPNLKAWADRMAAVGHGSIAKSTSAEALAAAQAATPTPLGTGVLADTSFQDDHGIPLGSKVQISAESFGTEVTEGMLIAATRTRLSIARPDERAGHVQVHFPRIGYVLKVAA
jgi:glutathione S-transferase